VDPSEEAKSKRAEELKAAERKLLMAKNSAVKTLVSGAYWLGRQCNAAAKFPFLCQCESLT